MEYIKIIGILGIALLISSFMSAEVFFVNSPDIRPKLIANWVQKTKATIAQLNPLSAGQQLKPGERPSEVLKEEKPLLMMKGVYAKSAPNMTSTEFNVNEMDWVEYSFVLPGEDGKPDRNIKIRVPKGQAPPSADILKYSQPQ